MRQYTNITSATIPSKAKEKTINQKEPKIKSKHSYPLNQDEPARKKERNVARY